MFTQLCGINSAVECQLPKLKVAGSNPVSRSTERSEVWRRRSTERGASRHGLGASNERAMDEFVVIDRVAWRSRALAVFEAMAAEIEARFGPPSERGLDSNGMGPFDALCLGFPCGLEVGLRRYHCGAELRVIDDDAEPSRYEVYANQRDLEHVAFHLAVPIERMQRWTDRDGHPVVDGVPRAFVVMRTDDNANDVEVRRVTIRCEAEALVQRYESRGHKQSYWIADAVGS